MPVLFARADSKVFEKSTQRLFVVDVLSPLMVISMDAAHEVTTLSVDPQQLIRDASGKLSNARITGRFRYLFAHLSQDGEGMTALDLSSRSQDLGVEVSGVLGRPLLQLTTLQIDYRDNLMHLDYHP